ncbi:MAG: hypothetical protein HZR80_20725 [Candidatus Heimdallarchaeota archaeon]
MRTSRKQSLAIAIIFVMAIPLVPAYVVGWRADESSNDRLFSRPKFSTHQWLAWEAVKLLADAQVSWITNNLYAFWHGVEAPLNSNASLPYGYTNSDYGDINSTVLYLDEFGSTVTNDALAVRAQEEYTKLVTILVDDNANFTEAAFHAGTMSHYISQAGFWGAIWDESIWAAMEINNWILFETMIERENSKTNFDVPNFNYRYTDMTIYENDNFTLSPTKIAANDAENATIDLAKQIHPLAQNLHDNVAEETWTGAYYNDVVSCLTWSVEAIYATLLNALDEVSWRYITIPDPVIGPYNATTHHMSMVEFEVTFTNNTGTHILNDSLASAAELWFVYYDDHDNPSSLSTDKMDLDYNITSAKWYLGDTLAQYTVTNSNQSIIYKFDMPRAAPTWSNITTDTIFIDFFNTTLSGLSYRYDSVNRELDIYNIEAYCWDLPEIGLVQTDEIVEAKWILYQSGEGTTATGEQFGVPARDTEGTFMEGDLSYHTLNGTWYSYDNDIGLVFTPIAVDFYVVIQFILKVPIGYIDYGTGTEADRFFPYIQQIGQKVFDTRDHQITITKPMINFDPETKTIDIYGIRAWSDYKNTSLDYEEIVNKTVHGYDRREARWKVFLWDGIASGLTDLMNWSFEHQYWFVENISLADLPDNDYYVSAKFVNMNINFTTSPWGPASDIFEIKRPIPVIYFILPEFFLAGFVVLFSWLAWYRPRKKRLQIEAERAEKLDRGFGD